MTVPHAKMSRFRRWSSAWGLVLLLFWPVLPALASHVRQLNLEEMVAAAGPIFSGRVVEIQPAHLGRLPATQVVFQVEEALRGSSAQKVVLTFPGGTQENGFPYRIIGLPRFRPGQRLILLAYPVSSLGLTSPVGLYQGYLPIKTVSAGLKTVQAAGVRTRLAATSGLPVVSRGASSISFAYGSFMARLRRLVEKSHAGSGSAPQTAPRESP